MRAALVLVDVQRDYLDRPGLEPAEAALVARLQALLAAARAAGILVLHAHTRVRRDGSDRMPHWQRDGVWKCVEGTPGAEAPVALAPRGDEPLLTKTFYSAFDNPQFAATLAARSVDTLVVAGLYTHACVRQTVLDAFRDGYRVVIASDAVGSCEPEHAQQTLRYLGARAAAILSVDEVIVRLKAAGEAAAAPALYEHRNPARWDKVLARVPLQSPAAVAQSIGQVRAAPRLADPRAHLVRLRAALEARREQAVDLVVREVAKPLRDARAEFDFALALLDYSLSQAEPDSHPGVRHLPVGTIGLVTPFNNPLAIPVGKLAPALRYGNSAVWKPALQAPAASALLMDCLRDAGLGAVVAMVSGNAHTGAALVAHPGIDAVSFTGSVAAGRRIAAACALAGKPLQAELGGNNAVIVLADADPVKVARQLAASLFSYSGQRCTAPRRVIVEQSLRAAFEPALLRAVAELKLGAPASEDTRIGPVISRDQQQRLLALCERSVRAGARLLCGGRMPPGLEQGCWIEPTLLAVVDPNLEVVQDETFGPLAVLQEARDAVHALELANAVEHGLVATLYSNSAAEQERFLENARAGILSINRPAVPIDPALPFGGWKASGVGPPEHGRWDFEFYTRPQAVYGRGT